ncbi:Pycsar system effector family protein [Streptomyces sp. NPDC041068]|uniref:Pycsar system effector family protein n=1 Tax=Streptomyces sp. NPDC041068 TaxID=3155130 RepID=UPI0033E8DD6C
MAETDPVETAWRIHGVLVEWTGKVDAKASFALTLESAALGAVLALSGSGHRLTELDDALPRTLFWLGASLLGLSALASVSVVAPRLRSGPGHSRENHFVYFGDLRCWESERPAERLRQTSPLESLTHQLVTMSQVVWVKNKRIRQSLTLAVIGSVSIVLAWLLS